MASSFVNATMSLGISVQDIYTAPSTVKSSVVHALYFSCTSDTSGTAVTLTIYDSLTSNTRKILNNVPIAPNSTLVLEKPINLKPNDKISASCVNTFCDVVASVLQVT